MKYKHFVFAYRKTIPLVILEEGSYEKDVLLYVNIGEPQMVGGKKAFLKLIIWHKLVIDNWTEFGELNILSVEIISLTVFFLRWWSQSYASTLFDFMACASIYKLFGKRITVKPRPSSVVCHLYHGNYGFNSSTHVSYPLQSKFTLSYSVVENSTNIELRCHRWIWWYYIFVRFTHILSSCLIFHK